MQGAGCCAGGSQQKPHPHDPTQVEIQEAYNQRAIQLSLLVACAYTAVGLLRLGWVTNFLSHSVVGGFTSGAAIITGVSQVRLGGVGTKRVSTDPPAPCSNAVHSCKGGYSLHWQAGQSRAPAPPPTLRNYRSSSTCWAMTSSALTD